MFPRWSGELSAETPETFQQDAVFQHCEVPDHGTDRRLWRPLSNARSSARQAHAAGIWNLFQSPCSETADVRSVSVDPTAMAGTGIRSHPEVHAVKRCHGLSRSSHLDLRSLLAPKQVKEKFAGRSTEPSRGIAVPNDVPLVGSRPLDLEPDPAQPATQIATTAAGVSPQRRLQRGREVPTGASVVRSAHVLVVDEELVQVRKGADPSDAEDPGRWARPDPLDKPPELSARCQLHPAPLGELSERPRKDEAGAREEITLAQHEVGSKVLRGPALDQRGSLGPELVEELTKCKALLRVKRKITHLSRTVP